MLRIDVSVNPTPAFIVEAVYSDSGSGVGPTAHIAIMEPLAHAHGGDAVDGVFPPVTGSDSQSVAILNIVDVAHHTLAAVAEAAVGCDNVVHHGCQCHAVVGKAVSPGQSGVGPVDHEDDFVVALANPVFNLACANAAAAEVAVMHPLDHTCRGDTVQ